jgi:hypothetical protein
MLPLEYGGNLLLDIKKLILDVQVFKLRKPAGKRVS